MKMKYRIVDSDNSNISFLIINYVSSSKVVQVGIMHSYSSISKEKLHFRLFSFIPLFFPVGA